MFGLRCGRAPLLVGEPRSSQQPRVPRTGHAHQRSVPPQPGSLQTPASPGVPGQTPMAPQMPELTHAGAPR
ncbi:unnamed protein product, partial [Gulo gulo]